MKDTIEKIAKRHLGLKTLVTRNSDSLDYSEQAVWDIKDALEEAFQVGVKYQAGVKETKTKETETEQTAVRN